MFNLKSKHHLNRHLRVSSIHFIHNLNHLDFLVMVVWCTSRFASVGHLQNWICNKMEYGKRERKLSFGVCSLNGVIFQWFLSSFLTFLICTHAAAAAAAASLCIRTDMSKNLGLTEPCLEFQSASFELAYHPILFPISWNSGETNWLNIKTLYDLCCRGTFPLHSIFYDLYTRMNVLFFNQLKTIFS